MIRRLDGVPLSLSASKGWVLQLEPGTTIEIHQSSPSSKSLAGLGDHFNTYTKFILGCNAFPAGDFQWPASTGHPSSLEQCIKWVKDCSEYHATCKVEKTLLPHRVIDIGHIEGEFCSECTFEDML
jgi:hypothetical protein